MTTARPPLFSLLREMFAATPLGILSDALRAMARTREAALSNARRQPAHAR